MTTSLPRLDAILAGGASSPVRAGRRVGGDPFVCVRAAGPTRTIRTAGATIDYIMAYGPLLFGHGHPRSRPGSTRSPRAARLRLDAPRRADARRADPRAPSLDGALRFATTGSEAVQERGARRARLHRPRRDPQVLRGTTTATSISRSRMPARRPHARRGALGDPAARVSRRPCGRALQRSRRRRRHLARLGGAPRRDRGRADRAATWGSSRPAGFLEGLRARADRARRAADLRRGDHLAAAGPGRRASARRRAPGPHQRSGRSSAAAFRWRRSAGVPT